MIATVRRRLAERFADLLPIRLPECPITDDPLGQDLSWHSRCDEDPDHLHLRTQIEGGARDMDVPVAA